MVRNHSTLPQIMRKLLFVITCIVLAACGSSQIKNDPPMEEVQQPPLPKRYENVSFEDFQGTPDVVKDYPKALEKCRVSTMAALKFGDTFIKVEKYDPKTRYDGNTLLVKTTVTEMRLVGVAARIWGGAFVGRSYMNLDVRLVDGASNKEIRSKLIYSSNNPFAASWIGSAKDRSLPVDMGKMIAEYLISVMPNY